MIIDDLDADRVPVIPAEANAVLVVDPNGMLAFALAVERFEVIAGRNAEHAQIAGVVDDGELAARGRMELGGERPARFLGHAPGEYVFGPLIRERLDHDSYIIRI